VGLGGVEDYLRADGGHTDIIAPILRRPAIRCGQPGRLAAAELLPGVFRMDAGHVGLGPRRLRRVIRAAVEPAHYRALANMVRVYPEWSGGLLRYLTGTGAYPVEWRVRTPAGEVSPTLYSYHDFLTVNEVFCREDYRVTPAPRVVVDFGSNIGLSALYFLTRRADSTCHLFEPDPRNVGRLKANLSQYRDRISLQQVAIGEEDGEVEFGVEDTGRYGGIGVDTGERIRVRARDVNAVLREVVDRDGEIDLLKVDIEGLEAATVNAIDPALRRSIRNIVMEWPGPPPALPGFVSSRRCFGVHLRRIPEGPPLNRPWAPP